MPHVVCAMKRKTVPSVMPLVCTISCTCRVISTMCIWRCVATRMLSSATCSSSHEAVYPADLCPLAGRLQDGNERSLARQADFELSLYFQACTCGYLLQQRLVARQ